MLNPFHLTPIDALNVIRMSGKYSWLTNDHRLPNPIQYQRWTFQFVENAYKYAKYADHPLQNGALLTVCTDMTSTPQLVRDLEFGDEGSERFRTSDHWDERKFQIMLSLNRLKYQANPDLASALIQTYPHVIVEVSKSVDRSGKPWGDRFWAICVGDDDDLAKAVGCNAMGRIAMQIRDELRAGLD